MPLARWIGPFRKPRRKSLRDYRGLLLRPTEFDQAAACERMRVDRNQSVLSILLITLPREARRPVDVRRLAKRLAKRLRMTDTAGRLRDGRVAVLLPDTPASGAWKVAADICDSYEVGPPRPDCEVMVYPERGPDEQEDKPVREERPVGAASAVGDSKLTESSDAFFIRESPAWKRLLDVAGASLGLAVASPVIAVAAGLVMATSRGGAFFTQDREGLGGRRFRMYKLRTMSVDAESQKQALRGDSEQDGPAFKMTHDPRVTSVGAFLRKTSLDELPQLVNVLRGDMSLVGPRPLPVDESQACRPWQRQRLAVKPGITCIWQVKGRSVVSFDEWVRMDLRYARRRSWWVDLKLMLQTPGAVLRERGPR